MIDLHSVVKTASELVKAKGFQQIKDPRTRNFRSALNDPKTKQTNNNKPTPLVNQLSRTQTT